MKWLAFTLLAAAPFRLDLRGLDALIVIRGAPRARRGGQEPNMPRRYRGALTLLLAVGAACYGGMTVPNQFQPIALGNSVTASVTFTRLIVRVPAGTEIGHHRVGLAKVKRYPYTWQSNLTVGSEEFKVIASEEMLDHGYNVKGGDNLLFGADESAKAEYQLGATLDEMLYDTFAGLAGNYSEARVHIVWELYDTFQRSVIYTLATNGHAKLNKQGSPVLQEAFRSALANLMADSGFVAKMTQSPRQQWTDRPIAADVTVIGSCRTDISSLPSDLEEAMNAVLVIRTGASTGSGVVVSEDGYALTAAHVVSGLSTVQVTLRSGLRLRADVILIDEPQDVALIKLPGTGHNCLRVESQTRPSVGVDLYAIGAPTGESLAYSVTRGIVSGVRELEGFSYIQTDASLNPGNSGGPLLTEGGNVVGIVSWKIAAAGFEGLSFGVPIDALSYRLVLEWRTDKR